MYNPRKNNRKSNRLSGYDYSLPSYYFITICVANRHHLFGGISDHQMVLNRYGKIARKEWVRTEDLRANVRQDAFVVMPNNMHGIIELTNRDAARRVPIKEEFGKPTKNTIPTIIRSYKSAVTNKINQIHNHPGDKIWQRNYHDHIIRSRHELHRIRK